MCGGDDWLFEMNLTKQRNTRGVGDTAQWLM